MSGSSWMGFGQGVGEDGWAWWAGLGILYVTQSSPCYSWVAGSQVSRSRVPLTYWRCTSWGPRSQGVCALSYLSYWKPELRIKIIIIYLKNYAHYVLSIDIWHEI